MSNFDARINSAPLPDWDGYLTDLSEFFDTGVTNLNVRLNTALDELSKDPSNAQKLAAYQSALSEYTLYRNAQSNVVKTYKDVAAAIIANYR
jgi:type III secretion protein F